MKREEKTIAKNKKAFHEYEILETLEAGIELTGASPAAKLKEVQALMAADDARAKAVYESIGV